MRTAKVTFAAMILLASTTMIASSSFAADTPAKDPAKDQQDKKQPAEGTAPLKFYGPVTKVDKDAKTFTVGENTYVVVPESKLTKAEKDATLADAAVGEPARGSYVKTIDGKNQITKVRFGKKAGGKAGGSKGGGKNKDAAKKEGETQKEPAKEPAKEAAK
jgi:hypothetical protein